MYDLGRFEPRRRRARVERRRAQYVRAPNRSPAERVRLGTEEQGSGWSFRRRRKRNGADFATTRRVVLVVGFVLALLLFLGMMGPDPLPGERVGEDVATFYAAQEYDRLMELWGDPGAARRGAEIKYQEVLSEWSAD